MLTSNQTVSLAWCLLLTTKRLVPRDSLHYPTVITHGSTMKIVDAYELISVYNFYRRPMYRYMRLIRRTRRTVWYPSWPSRTIWEIWLFLAPYLGGVWL